MSNWAFVAAAYTIVWGSVAIYAVVLARRVTQARTVARRLREMIDEQERATEGETPLCDAPPVD